MALQLGVEAGADAVVLGADLAQLCGHGRFLSTSPLTLNIPSAVNIRGSPEGPGASRNAII